MPGRDVIFRLKVEPDPRASAELQKFADEITKAQKRATATIGVELKARRDKEVAEMIKHVQAEERAAQKERSKSAAEQARAAARARAEELRLQERQDAMIARAHLQSVLKNIDDEKRARAAALREQERERLASIRRTAAEESRARISSARRFAGAGQLASGLGSIAAGVAYSGLVGEESSQKILNTLLAVEGARQIGGGAISAYKGIGAMAGGGAAGAAASAAAATAAVGLLALASTTAAVVASFETLRDAVRFGPGGGATPGSFSSFVGDKLAGLRAWNERTFGSQKLRDSGAYDKNATVGLVRSQETLSRQQAAQEQWRVRQAMLSGELREAGVMRQQMIQGNIGRAREALAGAVGNYNTAVSSRASFDVQQTAAQNVLAIQQEILRINRHQADVAVQGARQHYDLLRQASLEAKRLADESQRNLSSDLMRFAQASPFEQSRVRTVAGRLRTGQDLSRADLEIAGQYNAFEQQAQSAAEKRAMAAGAGTIFGDAISDSKRLAEASAAAAKQVAEAKVTLDQQITLQLKIDADELGDEDLVKLKPILDELNARNQRIIELIDQKIQQAVLSIRPPVR